MLSAKPPQCRIPKGTLGIGSPPSPHATRARRPGSLKITSSCASTGCGAVTLTASRRPRRHATARCVAVIAPACRHPSRQPSAPPFEKYGVERPRRGKKKRERASSEQGDGFATIGAIPAAVKLESRAIRVNTLPADVTPKAKPTA